MCRNGINCQNIEWTSGYMAIEWIGFTYLLESVSCEQTNGFEERQKNVEEKSAWGRPMRPLKIPCEGINRNCTLKDKPAYFRKEDSQFEDQELNME